MTEKVSEQVSLSSKNFSARLDCIIEYVIALLLILNNRSVYAHLQSVNLHLYVVLLFVLAVYIIKRNFFGKPLKTGLCDLGSFMKCHGIYVIGYYIFLGIFYIFNDIKDNNFISTFLLILPLLIYIYMTNPDAPLRILRMICDIMFVLAAFSLIMYLCGSLLSLIPSTQIVIHWGGPKVIGSFGYVYFDTQEISILGMEAFRRNTGIFTEAPMYSLALCLTALIETLIIKRNNRRVLATVTLATVTTFSATGMIIMALLYGYLILRHFFIGKIVLTKKMRIIILSGGGLIALVALFFLVNRLQTHTASIRIDDYRAAFLAWTDRPIFGVGYNNDVPIQEYMRAFRWYNHGMSNSLMVLMAQCGLYLFFLYAFPFLCFLITGIRKKDYDKIAFSVILFLMFATTIFMYTPLLLNFLAIVYAVIFSKPFVIGKDHIKLPKLKKKSN